MMPLQGNVTIERLCQMTKVNRAGFYRYLEEREAVAVDPQMELRSVIQQIFLEHRRRYGYRRITRELHKRGWQVNHKRVLQLMREDNLLAVEPRKFVVTTDSDHKLEVYLNLARRMTLTGIDQLWVADITYIRLHTEFVYLALVLDAFSRKAVGWALERTLRTELALAALEQAIRDRRPPPGLVHHSDRGLQYAAAQYVGRLHQLQILPSMSRPRNPYDNARCESFIRTLKREEIYANEYQDMEDLRAHLQEFIEQYYNRKRLHSALGYRSPEEFEQWANTCAASHTAQAASVSFFRHREAFDPDVNGQQPGKSEGPSASDDPSSHRSR
jgi:transposase InsO family protein